MKKYFIYNNYCWNDLNMILSILLIYEHSVEIILFKRDMINAKWLSVI